MKIFMVLFVLIFSFNSFAKSPLWSLNSYVDDFGEPTKTKYISSIQVGKFSNSASTNRNFGLSLLIDKKNTRLVFYQYMSHKVKASVVTKVYELKMRADKKTYTFKNKLEMYKGLSSAEFLDKSDKELFLKVLSESKSKIKLRFKEVGQYSSMTTYSINLNSKGFTRLYNKIK